jgi:predicted nucleotidyltransferase
LKFGLSDKSLGILDGIFNKYAGLNKVVMYGSRAKGNYRPGSDIDIALFADENFTNRNLLQMMNDFDDSDLPYMVDVCVYSKLGNSSQDLRAHIDRVGQVLWLK